MNCEINPMIWGGIALGHFDVALSFSPPRTRTKVKRIAQARPPEPLAFTALACRQERPLQESLPKKMTTVRNEWGFALIHGVGSVGLSDERLGDGGSNEWVVEFIDTQRAV